jgi:hypothetical protein
MDGWMDGWMDAHMTTITIDECTHNHRYYRHHYLHQCQYCSQFHCHHITGNTTAWIDLLLLLSLLLFFSASVATPFVLLLFDGLHLLSGFVAA